MTLFFWKFILAKQTALYNFFFWPKCVEMSKDTASVGFHPNLSKNRYFYRIPNKFADLDLNCCLKKCFHWIYWRPIPLKSNLCIIQIRLSDKAFILSPTKIHQKVCQSVSRPHILKSQQDSWWSVRAAIGSSLFSCTYVCLCLSLMSVFYSLGLPICFRLQNTIVEEALPVRLSVRPSVRASIGQSGVCEFK